MSTWCLNFALRATDTFVFITVGLEVWRSYAIIGKLLRTIAKLKHFHIKISQIIKIPDKTAYFYWQPPQNMIVYIWRIGEGKGAWSCSLAISLNTSVKSVRLTSRFLFIEVIGWSSFSDAHYRCGYHRRNARFVFCVLFLKMKESWWKDQRYRLFCSFLRSWS